MSRFQQIVFAAFIGLSVIFGYLGYTSLKNAKQPSVKALELIPDSCKVLLAFDNYAEFSNSLRNKNLLWQDLREISNLKSFEKHLNYFDSILNSDESFNGLAKNNPVYISIYENRQFLISLNVKELSDEKTFKEKLSRLFINPPFRLYSGMQNGVIVISNDQALLGKSFNSKTAKLSANKNFALFKSSVDYSGTSIYINNPGLLHQTYSGITIKPESIALNGLSIIDSSAFYGDIHSPPITSYQFLENIPLLCNAFEAFCINDAGKLFSGQQKNDWWKPVNDEALFNAKKQFYENISGYLISASLPSKNKALVVHITDSVKLSEILPFITDSSETGIKPIFRLRKNSSSFCTSTFHILKLPEVNYLVAFNDRLVFTVNKSDAEIFVNANIHNSSLLQNTSFNLYASKNFDTEFHYLSYALVNSITKDQLPFNELINSKDLINLKNISHFSFLSTFKKGFLNYRFNVKYFQEDILNEPNVLWTMNADTTIISKPSLFKNHTTGGNEIVFQSANNNLCLQNATGKILWKKHINEQLRSEIFIVDAFKNGKLQMLFSTDNYLHLVDRNGNYVQGYPVKLPAKATNKLCVFDYEARNDLRLFIACSDNKIYNYTIWGTKNEGFKPLATSSQVILPIKYCKVGLSDYLITVDRKGKIYAFSRKGDGRIDFKNKLLEDVPEIEIEGGNSLANTQIVYYDEKNHIIDKISLNDKKEIYKTNEHDGAAAYCFNDFDKNKITDVLIAESNKFEVYDITGNKLYTKENQSASNPDLISFSTFNDNTFVVVFDRINSKVIVTSIELQMSREYSSSTPALISELFNDGKPYVIVASGNKIKCYKL